MLFGFNDVREMMMMILMMKNKKMKERQKYQKRSGLHEWSVNCFFGVHPWEVLKYQKISKSLKQKKIFNFILNLLEVNTWKLPL